MDWEKPDILMLLRIGLQAINKVVGYGVCSRKSDA